MHSRGNRKADNQKAHKLQMMELINFNLPTKERKRDVHDPMHENAYMGC